VPTAWGLSFSYDIWANRTAQSLTSGSCSMSSLSFNNKNQITNSGFVYDAAGNMTAQTGSTYQYDAENRMTSVNGGSTATYDYGPNGERVRKLAGGATTYYFRDLSGQVLTELAPNNVWTVGYVYLHGQLLAQYKDGTTYFAHKDHLGSTRLLTKMDQSTQECTDYLPYGEQQSSVCALPGTATTTHKFTGQERDGEANLDYFIARQYAYTLGRFLQPDLPFADQQTSNPQSWNLYTYVRNNPLRYIDPTGHVAGPPMPSHPCCQMLPGYRLTTGFLSGPPVMGDGPGFAQTFTIVNAEPPPLEFVGPLTESQQSTYDSVVHAMANTQLIDKKGTSLGTVLSLIKSIKMVHGERAGAEGTKQFRLVVSLKDGAIDKLLKAANFGHSTWDGHVYIGGKVESAPSFRLKDTPSLQISYLRDRGIGDIDIAITAKDIILVTFRPLIRTSGRMTTTNDTFVDGAKVFGGGGSERMRIGRGIVVGAVSATILLTGECLRPADAGSCPRGRGGGEAAVKSNKSTKRDVAYHAMAPLSPDERARAEEFFEKYATLVFGERNPRKAFQLFFALEPLDEEEKEVFAGRDLITLEKLHDFSDQEFVARYVTAASNAGYLSLVLALGTTAPDVELGKGFAEAAAKIEAQLERALEKHNMSERQFGEALERLFGTAAGEALEDDLAKVETIYKELNGFVDKSIDSRLYAHNLQRLMKSREVAKHKVGRLIYYEIGFDPFFTLECRKKHGEFKIVALGGGM
jgi:RHS repeat-associated protein